MKNIFILPVSVTGALFMSGCSSKPVINKDYNALKSPNLIFIYSDDLGYGDLSCYGADQISTPTLDRLAS